MILSLALMVVTAHAQKFDLYGSAQAKAPILVFVHGGAWQSGSREDYKKLGQALSEKGVCVAVMEYRKSNVAKHPAPIEDLETLLKNLKAEKCDAKQVFLAGHSAGAHMISFWNTQYTNSNIRGLIGIEGIYDIPQLIHDWPDYRAWFIEREFGTTGWTAASPTHLKPKSKLPWLVIHSKQDELVNTAQSTDFVAWLKKSGSETEYFEAPTGSHFGIVENLATNDAGKKILAFIKRLSRAPRVPEG